jgi:hypothetical protein
MELLAMQNDVASNARESLRNPRASLHILYIEKQMADD